MAETKQTETKAKADGAEKAKAPPGKVGADGNGAGPKEPELLSVWELAPPRQPLQFSEDGKVHYLRSIHGLSTEDRATYARLRQRAEQLAEKKNRTKGQDQELRQVNDDLAKFVLPDMSDEQFEKLGALDKETAVSFFFAAFASTMTKLGEALGTALPFSQEEQELIEAVGEISES